MNDILVKSFVDDENLTQYQTAGEQSRSKKLSMEATTPPAEVPGVPLARVSGGWRVRASLDWPRLEYWPQRGREVFPASQWSQLVAA